MAITPVKPLLFAFILCILMSLAAAGQPVTISFGLDSIIYRGCSSYLFIHGPAKDKDYTVESSVGLIEKMEEGRYRWKVYRFVGKATLKVYLTKNNTRTLVREQSFTVQRAPDPKVTLHLKGYNHDALPMPIIPFPLVSDHREGQWVVRRYQVEIYWSKGDTTILQNEGRNFSMECVGYFEKMKFRDKIRITNVVAQLKGEETERTGMSSNVYEIIYR